MDGHLIARERCHLGAELMVQIIEGRAFHVPRVAESIYLVSLLESEHSISSGLREVCLMSLTLVEFTRRD